MGFFWRFCVLANYIEILLHEHCSGCIEIAKSLGEMFHPSGLRPLGWNFPLGICNFNASLPMFVQYYISIKKTKIHVKTLCHACEKSFFRKLFLNKECLENCSMVIIWLKNDRWNSTLNSLINNCCIPFYDLCFKLMLCSSIDAWKAVREAKIYRQFYQRWNEKRKCFSHFLQWSYFQESYIQYSTLQIIGKKVHIQRYAHK